MTSGNVTGVASKPEEKKSSWNIFSKKESPQEPPKDQAKEPVKDQPKESPQGIAKEPPKTDSKPEESKKTSWNPFAKKDTKEVKTDSK